MNGAKGKSLKDLEEMEIAQKGSKQQIEESSDRIEEKPTLAMKIFGNDSAQSRREPRGFLKKNLDTTEMRAAANEKRLKERLMAAEKAAQQAQRELEAFQGQTGRRLPVKKRDDLDQGTSAQESSKPEAEQVRSTNPSPRTLATGGYLARSMSPRTQRAEGGLSQEVDSLRRYKRLLSPREIRNNNTTTYRNFGGEMVEAGRLSKNGNWMKDRQSTSRLQVLLLPGQSMSKDIMHEKEISAAINATPDFTVHAVTSDEEAIEVLERTYIDAILVGQDNMDYRANDFLERACLKMCKHPRLSEYKPKLIRFHGISPVHAVNLLYYEFPHDEIEARRPKDEEKAAPKGPVDEGKSKSRAARDLTKKAPDTQYKKRASILTLIVA